jgi:alkylhydroperoxidase/carboxymuconolactone decarboxylase family protein YurZ
MVRNDRVSAGGLRSCWDLPGGSLRRGESLRAGLRREWEEETGLRASVGSLRLVMDGRKRRPGGLLLYTWRAFFFDVETSGVPVPGVGIDEVAWVPDDDVLTRLDAPYHAALRRHLQGEGGCHAEVDWVEEAPSKSESRGELRHLLIIAASAVVGARDELERELAQAATAGVDPLRIIETLLQVVPYAGYPRAITALGVARKFIPIAVAPSEPPGADAHARGLAVFRDVYGETSDAVLDGLAARDPLLARWTIEHAYGRVLCRDEILSLLERELLAVSILTAMGGLDAPLLGHMRAVLRLGGDEDDVRRAVQVVPVSFGEARRDAARALLGRLRKA